MSNQAGMENGVWEAPRSGNPYLLMWLEAPLQSWGHDSKFGRRDTLNFPTFSGVLGLVCAAMGRGGEQREFLSDFSDNDMAVIAYSRTKRYGDQEPEKRPREPLLRDFQMVGSGYDDKDIWQSLLIPKTSAGKKAVGGGTKMTYRYYLQDMAYAVRLELPEQCAEEIVEALQAPVWDLYLGRKCCAPTDIIYRGVFDHPEHPFNQAAEIAISKELAEDFRVLSGVHEGEVITLNDQPVQFGEQKQYRDRTVTIC